MNAVRCTLPDERFTKLPLIILTLCVLLINCQHYDLIIGTSAYEPQRTPTLTSWGKNVPYYMKEGQELTFQGTYAIEPYGKVGLVRRLDHQEGWSYVMLTETLPVEEGNLVEVRGHTVTVERPFTGIGRISRSNRLTVVEYDVQCDTGPFREKARREYAILREKLQKNITLPGSKLVLQEEPQWRVDWMRTERAIVVVAHSHDLMYAAEAQFLFPLATERLKTVYFQEWFKGE